jgi:pilus assembly protein CpaC
MRLRLVQHCFLGQPNGPYARDKAQFVNSTFVRTKLSLVAVMALSIGTVGVHQAFAQSTFSKNPPIIEDQISQIRRVSVTLFKSRTFKVNKPFDIADVMPMTDSSIYVQGKKIGTTNISIFDASKKLVAVLDLDIVPDTDSMKIKIMSSTGGHGIDVSSANGEVVLSGEASDSVSASRAVAVAKGLSPDVQIVDAMKVKSSQQVMLKVRFLEASRDAARDLGVNWFAGRGGARVSSGIGNATTGSSSGVPVIGTSGTFVGNSTAAPFGTVLANLVNGGTNIDVLLTALESKGLVKRLAEPDLIALSGDSASFLAGGEMPVPVVQANAGAAPTVTVDYKPFGVQLTFMPTVLANGIINLRLAPSVSEIDTSNIIQVSGFTIPMLTKREARTTVELRDGQSFAIAGLLQSTNVENINQVPWLGSVPVLGSLFRSTNFQKHETDLVIIVTPSLVKPAKPGDHIATPFDQSGPVNDIDLFALGQLERKRKYFESMSKTVGIQGRYGHILADPQSAAEISNE